MDKSLKKVLIDTTILNAGGGIQVAQSFINDLRELESTYEFYILSVSRVLEGIRYQEFPENFHFEQIPKLLERKIFLKAHFTLRFEAKIKPDVIFTIFGPSYHRSRCPKIVGFALPYMVYPQSPYFDKISRHEKLKLKLMGTAKIWFFKKFSDQIITETASAAEVLRKLVPGKPVDVVPNTLNTIFLNPDNWREISVRKSGFNIMCLSANYPHKNLGIIPSTVKYLKKHLGHDDFCIHISAGRKEFQYDADTLKNVEFLGRVPLECLPSLFRQMDVLLHPTLLEVFSTTYLEAMFMGVPIVTSDLPFAKDVCGKAALYADPAIDTDFAKNIVALYNDSALKSRIVSLGLEQVTGFGTSMGRTRSYLNIIANTIYNGQI